MRYTLLNHLDEDALTRVGRDWVAARSVREFAVFHPELRADPALK